MGNFKGKRGEALSMALIVLAMTLILDLETPDISDFLKLALIIGAGVLVTIVVSGIDYVWSWSRRAREKTPVEADE